MNLACLGRLLKWSALLSDHQLNQLLRSLWPSEIKPLPQ